MIPWRLDWDQPSSPRPDWPRVLILHSFYRAETPSGENDAVLAQWRLLKQHGVDVALLSIHSDDLITRRGHSARAAWNVATGQGADPTPLIESVSPDVIHLHNAFPNIATGWMSSSSRPIVASIHNYRALCANASFVRDGSRCTLCVTGSVINAVRHRCYRDSMVATAPIAWRNREGGRADPILKAATLVAVPSATVAGVYRPFVGDRLRLVHQPIDVAKPSHASSESPRRGFVFVGRLSAEKGIVELLEQWPEDEALTIVGDGPLMAQCRDLHSRRNLRLDFVGRATRDDVLTRLAAAEGLIFPSVALEAAPLVYGEALSVGTPVIALTGNSVADSVAADGTGVILEVMSTSAVIDSLAQLRMAWPDVSVRCEGTFEANYSSERWLATIRAVYAQALGESNGSERGPAAGPA